MYLIRTFVTTNNLPKSDKRIDKPNCMQICGPGLISISFFYSFFYKN